MIRLPNKTWVFAGPASNNGQPATNTNVNYPVVQPPPRTPLPSGRPGSSLPSGFVPGFDHSCYMVRYNQFMDPQFFYKRWGKPESLRVQCAPRWCVWLRRQVFCKRGVVR